MKNTFYRERGEEDKTKKITPLHIALAYQNNKSINIILKFMSLLDYSQFKTFMDIWPHMIDFSGFTEFLDEQTFFNMQMENK